MTATTPMTLGVALERLRDEARSIQAGDLEAARRLFEAIAIAVFSVPVYTSEELDDVRTTISDITIELMARAESPE